MVERICPACQHGNLMENRFCGACGASLERNELAPRAQDAIVIAGQSFPLAQVRQVGKAVAVGVAALAAEAGIAYLKRRVERAGLPSTALARPAEASVTTQQAAEQAAKVVTIVSQRVVEVWEQGTLARQIVEKHVWKKEG